MRKWQLAPILSAAVVTATATAFFTAVVMGIGVKTLVLETGWVCVLAFLGALAAYRIMLARDDHRAQLAGMDGMNPVHLWFMHREARVDHVAIPLTIGALLYTFVFGLFIITQLLDAFIRKLVTAFTFH